VAQIHSHATGLQQRFLGEGSVPGDLVPPEPEQRGNFLTFQSDHAGDTYRSLHERGVITDYRGDRLRIGFGIYQDEEDVDRLLRHVIEVLEADTRT